MEACFFEFRFFAVPAMDDTQDIGGDGASAFQIGGRQNHLPAGGDDVFDQAEFFPADVEAFGELTGSVFFGFFANEDAGDPGFQRQGG